MSLSRLPGVLRSVFERKLRKGPLHQPERVFVLKGKLVVSVFLA